MTGFDRSDAVDRLAGIVETVANERMPVPVREVWAVGDVALGLDPVERLDIYVTKDVLLRDDSEPTEASADGDESDERGPNARFRESHGIEASGSPYGRTGRPSFPTISGPTRTATPRPNGVSPHTSSRTTNPSTSRSVTRRSRTTSHSGYGVHNCARTTPVARPARGLSLGRGDQKRRGVSEAPSGRSGAADAVGGPRDARAGRRRGRDGGPRTPRLARPTRRRDGSGRCRVTVPSESRPIRTRSPSCGSHRISVRPNHSWLATRKASVIATRIPAPARS